jgi:3-oxoacyl-[acyl-carrier protein] reductase
MNATGNAAGSAAGSAPEGAASNARFSFAGATAVVTGGTRGIGAAISAALLEAGARVHATYQGNEAAARAFADRAAAHGGRLVLDRFDVADAAAVERFWEGLETERVSILVNNAGLRRDGIVGTLKAADWDRVIATNLSGSFHMSKFAVRHMLRARYGRIVFVTSPAASHGFAGQANYSASKAGQVGLMRSLAREVAKKKITANCVSPGFVDTDLVADLAEDVRREHLASVPLGRFGEPAEIAYAVLALCAREASYVNGAVLEVSGGL